MFKNHKLLVVSLDLQPLTSKNISFNILNSFIVVNSYFTTFNFYIRSLCWYIHNIYFFLLKVVDWQPKACDF